MSVICEPKVRAKIVIEIPSDEGTGPEDIIQWQSVGEPWAEIEHKDGGESQQADQQYAIGNTEFLIRYSNTYAGVNAQHRIRFSGDTYDILDFQKVPAIRARQLKITAKTRKD
jgi:SPP1 family predicted phage head-tail adaptor